MSSSHLHPETIYEIQIQGELDRSWETFFHNLTITLDRTSRAPTTTLTGPFTDQPALRGLLCKLWDLNLTLISVRRMEADSEKEDGFE